MIRKLLAALAIAAGMLAVSAGPALAGASACLTTTVTINGEGLPTNGTTCQTAP